MTPLQITIKIKSKKDDQYTVLFDGTFSHNIPVKKIDEVLKQALSFLWQTNKDAGIEIGKQLYEMLNEEKKLESLRARVKDENVCIDLFIITPFELNILPFEILYDQHFLVFANPPLQIFRQVTDNVSRVQTELPERPLQILFMACSPLNLEPVLSYEHEEELILKATENLPVQMDIEDSGSLEGLYQKIKVKGSPYDIIHITGHAGIDPDLGPVFCMEDETGELDNVTPNRLKQIFKDFPPQLLFVSGCKTGLDDTRGSHESFALQMAKAGVDFVSGWSLPVSDIGARLLTVKLYEELAKGKSISDAVTTALLSVAGRYHPWPLFRLFIYKTTIFDGGSEMVLPELVGIIPPIKKYHFRRYYPNVKQTNFSTCSI